SRVQSRRGDQAAYWLQARSHTSAFPVKVPTFRDTSRLTHTRCASSRSDSSNANPSQTGNSSLLRSGMEGPCYTIYAHGGACLDDAAPPKVTQYRNSFDESITYCLLTAAMAGLRSTTGA